MRTVGLLVGARLGPTEEMGAGVSAIKGWSDGCAVGNVDGTTVNNIELGSVVGL